MVAILYEENDIKSQYSIELQYTGFQLNFRLIVMCNLTGIYLRTVSDSGLFTSNFRAFLIYLLENLIGNSCVQYIELRVYIILLS